MAEEQNIRSFPTNRYSSSTTWRTSNRVTFDLDKNGIVNVSAKDLGTGKEQKITIQSNSGLSDDEIEKMVKDAEQNAEADNKREEEEELRNEADQLVFTTEKTLKEVEGKVDQAEVQKAEEEKDELKKAIESNDLEEIRAKKDALNQIVQDITVKLYEQATRSTRRKSRCAIYTDNNETKTR